MNLFKWLQYRIESIAKSATSTGSNPTQQRPAHDADRVANEVASAHSEKDHGGTVRNRPSESVAEGHGETSAGVGSPRVEGATSEQEVETLDAEARRTLGRRYAATIKGLVVDAYERECPELIADVLAFSLARVAVNGTDSVAITESYRLLSVHMTAMLEEMKAREASGRASEEEEEDRVLH